MPNPNSPQAFPELPLRGGMLPSAPTAQELFNRPSMVADAAATRVGYMNQMLQQPNMMQTVIAKGGELLKTALPVAGLLLTMWLGLRMVLEGKGPKFLTGK